MSQAFRIPEHSLLKEEDDLLQSEALGAQLAIELARQVERVAVGREDRVGVADVRARGEVAERELHHGIWPGS